MALSFSSCWMLAISCDKPPFVQASDRRRGSACSNYTDQQRLEALDPKHTCLHAFEFSIRLSVYPSSARLAIRTLFDWREVEGTGLPEKRHAVFRGVRSAAGDVFRIGWNMVIGAYGQTFFRHGISFGRVFE